MIRIWLGSEFDELISHSLLCVVNIDVVHRHGTGGTRLLVASCG